MYCAQHSSGQWTTQDHNKQHSLAATWLPFPTKRTRATFWVARVLFVLNSVSRSVSGRTRKVGPLLRRQLLLITHNKGDELSLDPHDTVIPVWKNEVMTLDKFVRNRLSFKPFPPVPSRFEQSEKCCPGRYICLYSLTLVLPIFFC